MRQKYQIVQDDEKHTLKIREFAVTDKDLKNVDSALLREENFSFLCEETYEDKAIQSSISKGMDVLVATLRTSNFFPIQPYAAKIAESVRAMYDSADNGSAELFFDDCDLVGPDRHAVWESGDMEEETEAETEAESSEIDTLFGPPKAIESEDAIQVQDDSALEES
jgi:hypothetical protein